MKTHEPVFVLYLLLDISEHVAGDVSLQVLGQLFSRILQVLLIVLANRQSCNITKYSTSETCKICCRDSCNCHTKSEFNHTRSAVIVQKSRVKKFCS